MKETIMKHLECAIKQTKQEQSEVTENLQRQISNLWVTIENQGARIAKLEKALDK